MYVYLLLILIYPDVHGTSRLSILDVTSTTVSLSRGGTCRKEAPERELVDLRVLDKNEQLFVFELMKLFD